MAQIKQKSLRATPTGIGTVNPQKLKANEMGMTDMERKVTKFLKLEDSQNKYNLKNLREKTQTSLPKR